MRVPWWSSGVSEVSFQNPGKEPGECRGSMSKKPGQMRELDPCHHATPGTGSLHLGKERAREERWTGCEQGSVPSWRVQNEDPEGTSLLISCQPGQGQSKCEQHPDPGEGGKPGSLKVMEIPA